MNEQNNNTNPVDDRTKNKDPVDERTAKTFGYQTTVDRNLRQKQHNFPKLTPQVYMEKHEVKTHDNYSLLESSAIKEKPHELHLIKKIGKLIKRI